jgi:hypothetical protein
MSKSIGDRVFTVRNKRVVAGTVVAVRKDQLVIDIGTDFAQCTIGNDWLTCCDSRAEACLLESARLRKYANIARRDADKKLEEAVENETRASELLAEAQRSIRGEIEE